MYICIYKYIYICIYIYIYIYVFIYLFVVYPNSITSLLGGNGAGKTTTISVRIYTYIFYMRT